MISVYSAGQTKLPLLTDFAAQGDTYHGLLLVQSTNKHKSANITPEVKRRIGRNLATIEAAVVWSSRTSLARDGLTKLKTEANEACEEDRVRVCEVTNWFKIATESGEP